MDSLVHILSKAPQDRTLEERLILCEKHIEDLEQVNHLLRVSLDGSMSLSRRIEKQFEESDKILTWVYKVVNQNYEFLKKR